MGFNPCCCFKLKDGAVTVGIWTLVYALASCFLFSWQTYVLNNCRAVTMAQSNLQCQWECPCVGASTQRTSRIIEGLFVIQVLCLISAFFLLFASASMVYGVHTWSRYLIWPWFPCMICSILCALAYCIMWWAGDVRDYWLALTILEFIGVMVNIYCLVVVMFYYRRVAAETDFYEGKDRRVRYRPSSRSRSRKDLMEHQFEQDFVSEPERIVKKPFPNYNNQEPPFAPFPQPQYPKKYVPPPPLPNPPYPDSIKNLPREPRGYNPPAPPLPEKVDLVSSWVQNQQDIGHPSQVNSEPPHRSHEHSHPLHHSRSVPSLFDATLASHQHCRHEDRDRHRSSSRHRSHRERRKDERSDDRRRSQRRSSRRRDGDRSRGRERSSSVGDFTRYSTESSSETATEFSRCRHSERKKHRSRSRHAHEETETETEYRHRRGHRAERERDERRDREDRHRRRDDADRRDDEDRFDRGDRRSSRRRNGERSSRDSEPEFPTDTIAAHPLSGGITIPQHIVIPPGSGERGADGRVMPQKFQINSEVVIKYDKDGTELEYPVSPPLHPRDAYRQAIAGSPYQRRAQNDSTISLSTDESTDRKREKRQKRGIYEKKRRKEKKKMGNGKQNEAPLSNGFSIPQHVEIAPTPGEFDSEGKAVPQKLDIETDAQIEYAESDANPLQNGFSIPQNILIPPSNGSRDRSGQTVPQKCEVDSNLRIHYDKKGRRRKDDELGTSEEDSTHPLSGGVFIPHNIEIPASQGHRGPNGQCVPQKYEVESDVNIQYERNQGRRFEDVDQESQIGFVHPLSNGFSIPHHIQIPPSKGEKGPDGKNRPQKYELASEVRIQYDKKQSQEATV